MTIGPVIPPAILHFETRWTPEPKADEDLDSVSLNIKPFSGMIKMIGMEFYVDVPLSSSDEVMIMLLDRKFRFMAKINHQDVAMRLITVTNRLDKNTATCLLYRD
jgi:hypothetical protein